ncbi:hypothetical protein HMPREF9623_01014 [Stomatobaculum longum]|uniref:Formate/nitrite transporter n=1 Tax=Stomatobaculum longum TaxID=796942 RepID=A0AA37DGR9_9FIRM|nr:hypothetical protein HMPREF9623_01014 [Stomatobaculum longum]
MYQDEFLAMTNAAAAKVGLLKKNPLGYFLMSMLAGAYIGFGILLIFTESGLLAGNPAAKIVMGASFCVALSLVIIAGAELFTGNTMVMTAGVLEGKISAAELLKLWCVCWLGNVAGSVLLALLFYASGLTDRCGCGSRCKGRLCQDVGRFCPACLARHPLQHSGMSCGLVRLSRQKRERQDSHVLLVSLRLHHNRL